MLLTREEVKQKFPSPYGVIFILIVYKVLENVGVAKCFRLLMELYSFLYARI